MKSSHVSDAELPPPDRAETPTDLCQLLVA